MLWYWLIQQVLLEVVDACGTIRFKTDWQHKSSIKTTCQRTVTALLNSGTMSGQACKPFGGSQARGVLTSRCMMPDSLLDTSLLA